MNDSHAIPSVPRTIIITGGERGIGFDTALKLVSSGWRVMIAGVDEAAAAENLPRLAALGPALFTRCDVGDEAQVAAMVQRTLEEFGALHGLVCNAGLATADNPPVESLSLEHWERVLRVNLTGAFLCVKHSIPALRQSRGAIVLISSIRAHASEPNTEAYSTSKAAMLGLNHSLANSLGPEIRVNAVCPGWIMFDHSELTPTDHAQQPVGRVGWGRDVVSAVEFLLDPVQAAFITGQHLNVDGGVTAKLAYGS